MQFNLSAEHEPSISVGQKIHNYQNVEQRRGIPSCVKLSVLPAAPAKITSLITRPGCSLASAVIDGKGYELHSGMSSDRYTFQLIVLKKTSLTALLIYYSPMWNQNMS